MLPGVSAGRSPDGASSIRETEFHAWNGVMTRKASQRSDDQRDESPEPTATTRLTLVERLCHGSSAARRALATCGRRRADWRGRAGDGAGGAPPRRGGLASWRGAARRTRRRLGLRCGTGAGGGSSPTGVDGVDVVVLDVLGVASRTTWPTLLRDRSDVVSTRRAIGHGAPYSADATHGSKTARRPLRGCGAVRLRDDRRDECHLPPRRRPPGQRLRTAAGERGHPRPQRGSTPS